MSLKTELALDRRKMEELHEGTESPKCESEEVVVFSVRKLSRFLPGSL